MSPIKQGIQRRGHAALQVVELRIVDVLVGIPNKVSITEITKFNPLLFQEHHFKYRWDLPHGFGNQSKRIADH